MLAGATLAVAEPSLVIRYPNGVPQITLAGDFASYVTDAFDWLWTEGATAPKMMTIGLHLRTIGRPGRIAGLDRVLRHVCARGGAWIARRDEIARHWLRVHGRGGPGAAPISKGT